jgi:exodeoxyribonuclease VII small subunit
VSDQNSPESDPSFEKELENLERVVDLLERGELGLEDAIRQYESGARSLKRCHQALDQARKKIEVLTSSAAFPPPDPSEAAESASSGVKVFWREEEVSGLDAEDPADSRTSD